MISAADYIGVWIHHGESLYQGEAYDSEQESLCEMRSRSDVVERVEVAFPEEIVIFAAFWSSEGFSRTSCPSLLPISVS